MRCEAFGFIPNRLPWDQSPLWLPSLSSPAALRNPKAPPTSRLFFPPRQRVFPYISAMVNNGSLTYDHDRDGRPTELGGCTAMVRNLNHDTFLVIRYVKRRLTVSAARGWSVCWFGKGSCVLGKAAPALGMEKVKLPSGLELF